MSKKKAPKEPESGPRTLWIIPAAFYVLCTDEGKVDEVDGGYHGPGIATLRIQDELTRLNEMEGIGDGCVAMHFGEPIKLDAMGGEGLGGLIAGHYKEVQR